MFKKFWGGFECHQKRSTLIVVCDYDDGAPHRWWHSNPPYNFLNIPLIKIQCVKKLNFYWTNFLKTSTWGSSDNHSWGAPNAVNGINYPGRISMSVTLETHVNVFKKIRLTKIEHIFISDLIFKSWTCTLTLK